MAVRVSLTTVVKNEAEALDRCLTSVQDLVDEIIVVDTGSSDNGRDIAKSHGAHVFDLTWPDSFSVAFNESIRHASGEWILRLDADEYFDHTNHGKLRSLLLALLDDNSAYVMQRRSPTSHGAAGFVSQVRLFRNKPAIRWEYRVHEQILPSLYKAGHAIHLTDITFGHSGYLDPALLLQKNERDLSLLYMDLAERPNDPFILFNLGWHLARLGRYGEAIQMLQRSHQHTHPGCSFTPNLFALLAKCACCLNQQTKAWAVCEAGLAQFPDHAELLLLKGELCHQRGDHAAARACWTQLERQSLTVAAPTVDGMFCGVHSGLEAPQAHHHLAVLDREEAQFGDAEMHWRAALAELPSFLPAQLGLAELYAHQARWTELEPLLSKLDSHASLDTAVLRARMALARQEFAAARTLLEGVIAQVPQAVPTRLYLTHVLLQEGCDPAAAEEALRQLLGLDPSQGDAWHNLAMLLQSQGRLAEAINVCRSARVYVPKHSDVLALLGTLLLDQTSDLEDISGRSAGEPVASATELDCTLPLAPFGQRADEAIEALRQAVFHCPDNALYQNLLGNALILHDQPQKAVPHFETAVRLQPESSDHHCNLGYILTRVGRPADAEMHCREAIRLQSDFIDAHLNLAMALWAQGRLDEGLQRVEEALRLDPEHPKARFCRAVWWLQQGDLAQGWPEYEWRWKQPNFDRRPCREPLWDGSPLHGRAILLWAEQGLGDTLQTIRFAREVQQQGAKVVVECQAPLVPLLSRCAGIDQLVPRGSAAPAGDVQAPLFSLPWLLGKTLESLAAEVPYLFADPALIEQWCRELGGEPGFKIGIAWQGNPRYYGDCMRSIPLKHFAALARLPGVRLFSLQKGVGSEQLQTATGSFSVVDLGCRLDEQMGAFMDTAAVMSNLDLVITSDTSLAHLAGGLGRPVWVALDIGCDWRFFRDREDNPWYPTMRLFRQKRFGDWDEVFNRMADELRQKVGTAVPAEVEEHISRNCTGEPQAPSTGTNTNQRSFCTMTARISLTMIVKNEAATLDRCLASVRDIVDEIIVVDTGSSDNTKDIAGQHGARVFDLPWPDSFAAARNESIRHATGQWLLWLDADEYFDETNRAKLRQLFTNLTDDSAYAMRQRSAATNGSATLVGQIRLFRNHPAIRWDYRVHEQILPSVKRAGHTVQDTDIAIEHTGYLDPALRHRKLDRNLRLLHLDMTERPNDPFTLFNLGWAFADLGRLPDAIPLLQRSLHHSHNADSITPKLYSLLTQCHRRLGQFAEAWSVCQAGHVRCPSDTELLFLKGQLCHQRGDRTAARTCWSQLLDDAPSASDTVVLPNCDEAFGSIDARLRGPLVRHHLAVLDREEGKLADAEKHWRAILDETPNFHPARIGLAEMYLRQERWPELESTLAELQPHAPIDAAVLQARMNLARKEFDAARQLLEDILRQAPHHLPAQVILSHVLLQSGDERAAEPQLRRIVEIDPGQAESWKNLAVLYRRTQRLREAIAAIKASCLHCPQNADLVLLEGVLLREGGDAINAETRLLRALEMATGDGPARQIRTTARQHLVTLYRDLGRHREANAHFRALTIEAPDLAHNLGASRPQSKPSTNGQVQAGSAP